VIHRKDEYTRVERPVERGHIERMAPHQLVSPLCNDAHTL
jgi:hypothetical protein